MDTDSGRADLPVSRTRGSASLPFSINQHQDRRILRRLDDILKLPVSRDWRFEPGRSRHLNSRHSLRRSAEMPPRPPVFHAEFGLRDARKAGAKATALQTLARPSSISASREASRLRRVYRRFSPGRPSQNNFTPSTTRGRRFGVFSSQPLISPRCNSESAARCRWRGTPPIRGSAAEICSRRW